jgi:hypothetical protein
MTVVSLVIGVLVAFAGRRRLDTFSDGALATVLVTQLLSVIGGRSETS